MEPIESTEGSQSSSLASKPKTVESNESIDGRVAAALEWSEQIVLQLRARVSFCRIQGGGEPGYSFQYTFGH